MKATLPASLGIDLSSAIAILKQPDPGGSPYDIVALSTAGENAMADARPFDPALFADAAIDAETAKLIQMLTGQPEWWIVGAAAMRAARRRGEGPFPAPVMSNRARTLTITGKDGNEIALRVIAPPQPRGIYLHLHGGGWVLGGADMQDPMLERITDNTGQALSPWSTGWHRSTPGGSGRLRGRCRLAGAERQERIRHRRSDDRR
jgi:acetyl esterase/lipase